MNELRKVTRAADKAARALRARDDTIREAHASGLSLRTIAEAADLSHQRIHQIVTRKPSHSG